MPLTIFAQINTCKINNGKSKLKILAVNDNVSSEDNYSQPDSGNKFLSVNVMLDNRNSHSDIISDFFNLKLSDSNNNFYQSSIKSFVVKKPYLVPAIIAPGRKISGWATFEIPKNLSINSLQIRYEQSNKISSDWIPLWTLVSSSEDNKKLKKQVAQNKINSMVALKKIVLIRTIQSINNYIKYLKTSEINFLVDGIKNASQAKLLTNYSEKPYQQSIKNVTSALNNKIILLSNKIPENLIKCHPPKHARPLILYLKKMKNEVVENYVPI